jgi:hypothetical protein
VFIAVLADVICRVICLVGLIIGIVVAVQLSKVSLELGGSGSSSSPIASPRAAVTVVLGTPHRLEGEPHHASARPLHGREPLPRSLAVPEASSGTKTPAPCATETPRPDVPAGAPPR